MSQLRWRLFIECKASGSVEVTQIYRGPDVRTMVRDVVSEQGLDLSKIANLFRNRQPFSVGIISHRPIFNWPEAEWNDAEEVQLTAPNCPAAFFNPNRVNMSLVVPEIPSLFHLCKKLISVHLHVSDASDLHKKLLPVSGLRLLTVYFTGMPVWWPVDLFHYNGHCQTIRGIIYLDRFKELYVLQVLVTQGILSEGLFRKWLTRGLYDPRLLREIASFIQP